MSRNYETRVIVGDEQRRLARELRDYFSRVTFISLQIENVTNAAFGKLSLFLRNAFENKRVKPIVGPGIGECQPFVDYDRQSTLVGHLNRKVKRVVVTGALEHLHPVKDVAAFLIFRNVV